MTQIKKVVIELVCDREITDKRLVWAVQELFDSFAPSRGQEWTRLGIRQAPIRVKSLARVQARMEISKTRASKLALTVKHIRAILNKLDGRES